MPFACDYLICKQFLDINKVELKAPAIHRVLSNAHGLHNTGEHICFIKFMPGHLQHSVLTTGHGTNNETVLVSELLMRQTISSEIDMQNLI